MKLNISLIIIVLIILCSCKKDEKHKAFKTNIEVKNTKDRVYITELITNKTLAIISPMENKMEVNLEYSTVASIKSKNTQKTYLITLTPNRKTVIIRKEDSTFVTNKKADSILNYLWHSNLDFAQKNSTFIFKTKKVDSIVNLFETFRLKRKRIISSSEKELNNEEFKLLNFQNEARIYSFLFWLGRISKELDPHNSYFDFIQKIGPPKETLKTLPDIYLYKYEIEYLREKNAIKSIEDFLVFIETKTANKDLGDFLKIIYLKALIENPSYWEKHENLFNSEILISAIKKEENNQYYYLIEKPMTNFFSSQSGEVAYNFIAERPDGSYLHLSDLKGKVVFIDVWATWCGPCLKHRPNLLQFAEKYKDHPDVEILTISVDQSKEKWLGFMEEQDKNYATELIIENGMRTKFGAGFNIKTIPKYILIDKKGVIISSAIKSPSFAVEQLIEIELKK